jgi:2-isopropylmalate synthase
MQLNVDGTRVSGAAIDRDTVSASLKALLSALNKNIGLQSVAA